MDNMHNLKANTTAYKNQFNKDNYKQLKANIKPENYNKIDDYCKQKGISKASFIIKACDYCIDNNILLDIVDGDEK